MAEMKDISASLKNELVNIEDSAENSFEEH
jgi:hypothetical protein